MKKLIYTIICFKCILQLTEGSRYQRYIRLFAQLLILCMCCGLIIQLAGNVKKTYENLEERWSKITDVLISEEDIKKGNDYYDGLLMEYYEEASAIETESEIID